MPKITRLVHIPYGGIMSKITKIAKTNDFEVDCDVQDLLDLTKEVTK